jgi:hypothetical protein
LGVRVFVANSVKNKKQRRREGKRKNHSHPSAGPGRKPNFIHHHHARGALLWVFLPPGRRLESAACGLFPPTRARAVEWERHYDPFFGLMFARQPLRLPSKEYLFGDKYLFDFRMMYFPT